MPANIKPTKRMKVYNKYGGRCAYCGCFLDINNMTIDHIVPKSGGGDNKLENLNPSCKRCNNIKGNISVKKFKTKVKELTSKGEFSIQLNLLIDGNYTMCSNVIARCNFPLNQGYLTRQLIDSHSCIEKQCYFYEKLDNGFWQFLNEV